MSEPKWNPLVPSRYRTSPTGPVDQYDGPDWRERAECRRPDVPTDAFYPEPPASPYSAKKVCEWCPVRVPCLVDALETNDRWAIRAGLSADQRRQYRSRYVDGLPMLTGSGDRVLVGGGR